MLQVLCFYGGVYLVVHEVLFTKEPSVALLIFSMAILGLPVVVHNAAPPLDVLESKEHLTALDKAWLGYHHYLSSPDA